jgi:hypothetical protein
MQAVEESGSPVMKPSVHIGNGAVYIHGESGEHGNNLRKEIRYNYL